jgi:hypothetical protein
MSPRNEFHLGTAIFVAVCFGLGAALLETKSPWFAGALVAWVFIGSRLMSRVKCPGCGKSITVKSRAYGMSLHAGYAPRQCANCGRDLNLPRKG